MTEKSFPTASNDEALLSFLRERGILADESITPQQVEEKKCNDVIQRRYHK